MPKVKTNSSAKKRLRVTASGKLKRKHSGLRHNLRKKTTKAKRALVKNTLVSAPDMERMKNMLNL